MVSHSTRTWKGPSICQEEVTSSLDLKGGIGLQVQGQGDRVGKGIEQEEPTTVNSWHRSINVCQMLNPKTNFNQWSSEKHRGVSWFPAAVSDSVPAADF